MDAEAYGKPVQYRRSTRGDKAWFDLSDHRKPLDPKVRKGTKDTRLTLDLEPGDLSFLGRLAAYRTAMARLSGRESELPPEGKWTRKALAESLMAAVCNAQRAQLREMIDACGEIPDPKDIGELNRYVARVFAWSEQLHNKKR